VCRVVIGVGYVVGYIGIRCYVSSSLEWVALWVWGGGVVRAWVWYACWLSVAHGCVFLGRVKVGGGFVGSLWWGSGLCVAGKCTPEDEHKITLVASSWFFSSLYWNFRLPEATMCFHTKQQLPTYTTPFSFLRAADQKWIQFSCL
jgi:hypothetical protein